MPLIRIANYPRGVHYEGDDIIPVAQWLKKFAAALREAAVSAEVPGIDHISKVTVVSGGEQIITWDRTLVIMVEGLFDRPDRDKIARDRLAKALGECCRNFVAVGSEVGVCWKVEVLIGRFDTDVESYYEIGGPEDETPDAEAPGD